MSLGFSSLGERGLGNEVSSELGAVSIDLPIISIALQGLIPDVICIGVMIELVNLVEDATNIGSIGFDGVGMYPSGFGKTFSTFTNKPISISLNSLIPIIAVSASVDIPVISLFLNILSPEIFGRWRKVKGLAIAS